MTFPVLFTNFDPNRLSMKRINSVKKLKNLILNDNGPKLKLAAMWIVSMAPKIDIADEKVVAK